MQQFRGGLVFKAHRLLHHSTLGVGVINKKKKGEGGHLNSGAENQKDLLLVLLHLLHLLLRLLDSGFEVRVSHSHSR